MPITRGSEVGPVGLRGRTGKEGRGRRHRTGPSGMKKWQAEPVGRWYLTHSTKHRTNPALARARELASASEPDPKIRIQAKTHSFATIESESTALGGR